MLRATQRPGGQSDADALPDTAGGSRRSRFKWRELAQGPRPRRRNQRYAADRSLHRLFRRRATFPGAVGAVRRKPSAPDTRIQARKDAYGWAAGYRHSTDTIVGFSHTHFSGTGSFRPRRRAADAGVRRREVRARRSDVPAAVTPRATRTTTKPPRRVLRRDAGRPACAPSSPSARASACIATRSAEQTGARDRRPAHLDVRLPGQVLWSRIRVRADGTVTGMRETRGWAPGSAVLRAAFLAAADQAIACGTPNRTCPTRASRRRRTDSAQRAQIEGRQLVARFDFRRPPVGAAGGRSSRSRRSAGRRDRQPRCRSAGLRFRPRARAAQAQWAQALGVAEVDAPAPMRKAFFTALYHAFMGQPVHGQRWPLPRPRQCCGAPGQGAGRTIPPSRCGTYRAASAADHRAASSATPTSSIRCSPRAAKARTACCRCGRSTAWETWCMIGYHAVPVIADALHEGHPRLRCR